jgi:DNA-binding transcriptional MerR regulator
LRYYDEIGLLEPAFYGENQYRYHKEEQLIEFRMRLDRVELNKNEQILNQKYLT